MRNVDCSLTPFQIFMTTYQDKSSVDNDGRVDEETGEHNKSPSVEIDKNITTMTGAWEALAEVDSISGCEVEGLLGKLPNKFQGLATPEKNPMSMQVMKRLWSGARMEQSSSWLLFCNFTRLIGPAVLSFFFVVVHVHIVWFGNRLETHEFVSIR